MSFLARCFSKQSPSLLRCPTATRNTLSRPRVHLQTLQRPNQIWRRPFRSTSKNSEVYVRFGGSGPNPSSNWSRGGRRPFSQWDLPTKLGAGVIVLAGGFYLYNLEQVPETGRWRFMMISPEMEESLIGGGEGLLGENEPVLPPNHPLTKHVHQIVTRILEANNLGHIKNSVVRSQGQQDNGFEDLWDPSHAYSGGEEMSTASDSKIKKREWEVRVVNDQRIVNASALPGVVSVYTGILPVCQDDDGLAAVLSHEIGHVVARHSAERLSTAMIFYPFALFASIIISNTDLLTSFIAEYVLQRPNGRKMEREADLIGLRMMAKACFDPRAAPAMFQRLDAVEKQAHGGGSSSFEFMSTHPLTENRVAYLRERLPEAYDIQASSSCADTRSKLKFVMNGFKQQVPVSVAPSNQEGQEEVW